MESFNFYYRHTSGLLRHQRRSECTGNSVPVANLADERLTDEDLAASLTVRENAAKPILGVRKLEEECVEAGVYGEYDRLTRRSLFEAGIPATYK